MTAKPGVLFVDDEDFILKGLQHALAQRAPVWEMTFSRSPQEALDLFRANPYAVVVTDVSMPGMNGIYLIVAMREIRKSGSFILLTGMDDMRLVVEAINRAEVYRFLSKPCSAALLMQAIEQALRVQQEQQLLSPSLGAEVLDAFAAALLVVAEARVQFMNQPARQLGASGDGIQVGSDQVLRTSSRQQTARLHEMIRLAALGQAGGSMCIECPQSERTLAAVIVAPTPGLDPAKVAIYLRFPGDWHIASAEELMTIFNLTHAESQVAHSLALGLSLGDSAALSGITVGTARNYLKRVFAKTGTSRQVELVNLVLSYSSPFV